EPAIRDSGLLIASIALLGGAVTFTLADYLIDERWGGQGGGGLLAAISLDGVPENLALGVALIGASIGDVLSLAASIFLSNLPEAAGGAANMIKDHGRGMVLGLWAATARSSAPRRWPATSFWPMPPRWCWGSSRPSPPERSSRRWRRRSFPRRSEMEAMRRGSQQDWAW
ncbi:MAG: hypothetical protein ABIO99_11445, partial [Candidatus Limnocylindria bacterium]